MKTFVNAFIGAFVLAFVLGTAADAVAQSAEAPVPTEREPDQGAMPEHGFAPPSDEEPPATGVGPAAGSAGNPTDPHAGVDQHTGTGGRGAEHGDAHADGHGDAHAVHPPVNWAGHIFTHYGKDAFGGPLGDGKMETPHGTVAHEEPMSAPFILMVANFAILLWLLIKFGGKAGSTAAAERHDQIKSALEEAATLRKQAADKLAEYEAKLKKSDEEIKAMVDAIRASAESDKARILEAAERSSQQMKKDAESRIAAEIELARTRLTREVTEAATAATEKILRDKLMPADQQSLVSNFIADLGNAKAGQPGDRR